MTAVLQDTDHYMEMQGKTVEHNDYFDLFSFGFGAIL